MEVKRICQWCGKPFIAQKTTTCYCSPQCSKRGYKHRMMERKMELRHMQEMQELRSSLEKQEYFTFSQAARLMGVSRQYIYKLVKEEKLRASRLSGKMSLIRKADIELMLKSKPYERLVAKNDFDITEYYTAEEIAQKYLEQQISTSLYEDMVKMAYKDPDRIASIRQIVEKADESVIPDHFVEMYSTFENVLKRIKRL